VSPDSRSVTAGARSCRPPARVPQTSAPLDYAAFRERTYTGYMRYAYARTGQLDAAAQVVDALFGHLVTVWPQVLSSAGPAAMVWHLLRSALARHAPCCCAAPAGCAPHVLPPSYADALVLRHLLALPRDDAADLMGVTSADMGALLTVAERSAPPCLLTHLRHAASGCGLARCMQGKPR
jgi:hypothetical protein